jgi:hypothetical protein
MFSHSRKEGITYRISTKEEHDMRVLAGTLDLVGFLATCTGIGAILAEILGFVGNTIFFFWFRRKKMNYLTGGPKSKSWLLVMGPIIEIFPFLNGFYPGFTIQVNHLVASACKEDEEKGAKVQAEQQMQQIQQARAMRSTQIREMQLQAREQQALEEEETAQ